MVIYDLPKTHRLLYRSMSLASIYHNILYFLIFILYLLLYGTKDSKMLEKSVKGMVKLNNFLLFSSSVDEDEDVDSVSIALTF